MTAVADFVRAHPYPVGMENDLVERSVDFSYDAIALACPHCSGRATFTFMQYIQGLYVPCLACARQVTSKDPLDLLPADPDDPALNAEAVTEFAWYHTTTRESWPPAGRDASDDALHVGTYEAAIENMVRGMADQSRADEQFYLNRVRIRTDADRVAPGIARDPGGPFTGRVPLGKVRWPDGRPYGADEGFLVLRYLNRYEHRGRVSLAVDPEAIVAVQTLLIPPAGVAAEEAVAAQFSYGLERKAFDQSNPDGHTSIQLAISSNRGFDHPLVAAVGRYEDRVRSARDQYLQALRRSYLPDIGDCAFDKFEMAISRATTVDLNGEHTKYLALAGTFSDARKIITTIAAEPVKLTSESC